MNNIDKAIKSLQNIIEYWSYRPSEVEAAKLAISALEKQISKNVINDEGLNETRCPSCNTVFGYCLDEFDYEQFDFCYSCGQKLDWAKEDCNG